MSKGTETKQSILDHGMALASVKGLGGVTIGSLAQHVGMSKSGLYGHFQSKENLQIQLLEQAAARFVETIISPSFKAPRGEPRVRALFENWLKWANSPFLPGGCIFVEAAVEFDDQPGPVRDHLVRSQKDWLDTLANAARMAVEEGHFHKDLDTAQFAFEMYTLVYGYHFVSRLLNDPDAEKRARQSMERIIQSARPPVSGKKKRG